MSAAVVPPGPHFPPSPRAGPDAARRPRRGLRTVSTRARRPTPDARGRVARRYMRHLPQQAVRALNRGASKCAAAACRALPRAARHPSPSRADPGLADDAGYSIAWGCCGHVFHLDCISRWLKTRSVCPLCNREWEFAKIEKIATCAAARPGPAPRRPRAAVADPCAPLLAGMEAWTESQGSGPMARCRTRRVVSAGAHQVRRAAPRAGYVRRVL